jgi:hypothetical protein
MQSHAPLLDDLGRAEDQAGSGARHRAWAGAGDVGLLSEAGRLAGGDALRAGGPGADCRAKEQARDPDRPPVRHLRPHTCPGPPPAADQPEPESLQHPGNGCGHRERTARLAV